MMRAWSWGSLGKNSTHPFRDFMGDIGKFVVGKVSLQGMILGVGFEKKMD